jgi:YVTN family beta-propeller protein
MRGTPAVALALLAACHPRAHPIPALEPLSVSRAGEVYVYLQPFPGDAARLALSIGSVEAFRSDGVSFPLEVALPEVSAPANTTQRLLGWARLPAGSYSALLVQFRRATLTTEEGMADLVVPKDPVRVSASFAIRAGHAIVVQVALREGQARRGAFGFAGNMSAVPLRPEDAAARPSAYCSSTGTAELFVIDRHVREVAAILPAGREPQGFALDVARTRVFVALAGEDQVQVLDLNTGEELQRIPLVTGDRPREIRLTPDGGLLLVINQGSNTAAFLDPVVGVPLSRVPVGEDPRALLLDHSGRRAYVLNRRSNTISIVDMGSRVVVATIATDPEPLRAALSRDGTRLYVIHRGSAYLNVYSLPDQALVNRIFVGLGATALLVDIRTDLLYVAGDDGRIQLFDPSSLLLPLYTIDVPGPATYLALDDVENMILALVPSLRQVAFIDVTRKRLVSTVDVSRDAYQVAPAGERF